MTLRKDACDADRLKAKGNAEFKEGEHSMTISNN
jgi:hypothetical protein